MRKIANDHYYVVDKTTGIIFRTVGPTDTEDLIVYPKYIPNQKGKRKSADIPYRGVQYPSGSIRFLSRFNLNLPGTPKIKFAPTYGAFLPIVKRSKVLLLEPKNVLLQVLGSENSSKIKKDVEQVIKTFTATEELKVEDFGFDASLLAGVETGKSDIDLVIYGAKNALAARKIFQEGTRAGKLQSPYENPGIFIKRRVKYSPLMTHSEILLWESRKISGLFGRRKFSLMPVDPYLRTFFKMCPTNLDVAIRAELEEDKVVFDPGIICLKKSRTEVIYGPKEITLRYIFTYLPSRMGIFLEKGDRLFSCGRLYKMTVLNTGETSYALTQFPWDDNYFPEGTKFVTKIEQTAFDGMIPQLFGHEFTDDDYTS